MKKFLGKTLLFSIPILLYFGLVSIVDPFDFFGNGNDGLTQEEKEAVNKINYPLYQMLDFDYEPKDRILLGDSRTRAITDSIVGHCYPYQVANLAYGGGSVQEIINTFWHVDGQVSLKEVYIGVNFNLYNESYGMDRVSEAIRLKESFLLYAGSKFVYRGLLALAKEHFFSKDFPDDGTGGMDFDDFWSYQLNSSADNFYRMYAYPEGYYQALKGISAHCEEKGIKLVFFIPPTHTDLQDKIDEFNLREEEAKFKTDLNSLGEVLDFDIPSPITQNKSNFLDPFHVKGGVLKTVVDKLLCNPWGLGSDENMVYYPKGTLDEGLTE